MNTIIHWIDPDLVQALGWTLLHSLWQGGTIALLLALGLIGMRKLSALTRYWVALGSMMLLMISIVFTFSLIYEPAADTSVMAVDYLSDVYQQQEIPEAGFDLETQPVLSQADHPAVFTDYFETHLPLLVMAWLLGVLLLCLRMLGEIAYIEHLKNYRCRSVDASWLDKLATMRAQLNIQHEVQFKETFRIHAPMVVGVFKPVILFPIGLLANLPVAQVESILAHELAHIRRHDYLINLFQSLVEILLFFNPAMWWISAKIKAERENSCDDLAINMTGDTVAFVKSLARLEEWRLQGHGVAMSFTGQKKGVLGRIQRLLNRDDKQQIPAKAFWSLSVIGICMALFLFQATPVESQSSSEKRDTNEHVQEPQDLNIEQPEETGLFEPVQNPEGEDVAEVAVEIEERFSEEIEFLHANADSLPDQEMAKLEAEIEKLEIELHKRMRTIETQMRELQSKELLKQKELQMAMQERQKKMMELELNIQKQENEKNLLDHGFEISANDFELEGLKLEQLRYDLDIKREQLEAEEATLSAEALKTRLLELQNAQRAILEKESALKKRRHEAEKNLRQEMMQREKELQQLQNSQSLMEQEFEMMERENELEMLKFEQERENLSVDERLIERDLEARYHEMEARLEKMAQQQAEREKQE
ncbi:MAG: hypothetical protein DHS20C18_07040 [Saprospiraceae bacterium]|nr:MAG: hypothetical protein DHS20C18_07040 [Saprospiraceae bacterium]